MIKSCTDTTEQLQGKPLVLTKESQFVCGIPSIKGLGCRAGGGCPCIAMKNHRRHIYSILQYDVLY